MINDETGGPPSKRRFSRPVVVAAAAVFALGLLSSVAAAVSGRAESGGPDVVQARIAEIIASDQMPVLDEHGTGEQVGRVQLSLLEEFNDQGFPVYDRVPVYDDAKTQVGYMYQGYGYVSLADANRPDFDVDALAQKVFGRDALEVFQWQIDAARAANPDADLLFRPLTEADLQPDTVSSPDAPAAE